MDYKEEIIEMIQKINSESMIKFIYGCVKRAHKEECSEEKYGLQKETHRDVRESRS